MRLVALSAALLTAFIAASCGVKGPPLPMVPDTPDRSDRILPSPSPSPSPSRR